MAEILLPLVQHPDCACAAVSSIRVRVVRDGSTLQAAYRIAGEMARLRIPPPAAERRAGELWRHTCCEVFVAREGTQAYHEFNFSPSGEWAAYAFESYRKPAGPPEIEPRVRVRTSDSSLELDAEIACHGNEPLALALSAVIEAEDGTLSYWALRHPPGKPDFHHPDAFALELS